MAGNVSGLHVFANDVGPVPLALLDQNYDALVTALNTLSTFSNFYADTGTTNQLNVTAAQHQLVSYTDGLTITVRVAATNTGASTLNVNGLGAQPILTSIGSELQPNALVAGSIVTFVYNAQRTAWQIASGGGGGQITMPFMVTNAQGEAAFAIFPDGSGTLGSPGPCGLDWDANCNFWFSAGAGIRSMFAPFTVSDASGNPVFNVTADGSGSIDEGGGNCQFMWGDVPLAGGIADACFLFKSDYNTLPNPTLRPWVAAFAANGLASSNGVYVFAGTTATDTSFQVMPTWGATSLGGYPSFQIKGDGSGVLGPPVADGVGNQLVWDAQGHFTLTGTATLPMPPLIDLPGISITNPQNGEALVYDSANNQWVNGAPVNALVALNDVALAAPVNGQALIYNAATNKWVNAVAPLMLEQLTNAHVSGPASGQVLTYSVNPTPGWVNATLPGYAFLNSLGVGPNPQTGWVLTWDGNAWVGAAPGEVSTIPLTALTDVSIQSPLNRQVLTWDAPNSRWINAPAATPSLATLPDVALTSQTQGQVLAWNATANRWENSSLPGGAVIALDTLMDTNISDPQNNQVLTWDYASARWVNRSPVTNLSALSDVTLTSPASGQVLAYTGTHWVNTTPVSVTVAATAPANPQSGWLWWDTVGGQLYVWFPNQWVMANSANLPPQTLANLLDVALATPTNGQVLVYNAASQRWVNGSTVNDFTVGGTSGIALTVNGVNQQYAASIKGGSSSGGSFGLLIEAGSTGADYALNVTDYASTLNLFRLYGDGSGQIGRNGCLKWGSSGMFILSAPTGGNALTVNAAVNSNTLVLSAPNATSQSFGAYIIAGTNQNDYALAIRKGDGLTNMVTLRGDGALYYYTIPQGAANYNVQTNAGLLYYPTSSRRFKDNIRDVTRQRARDIVRKLRTIAYTSTCKIDDPEQEHYGLVAEEVAEIDPRLVCFDKHGQADNVKYEQVLLMLLPLMQEILGMDEPEGAY